MRLITAALIGLFHCSTLFAQFSWYLEQQIPVSAGEVTSIALSGDGRFLAFGDQRGHVHVWDVEAGRALHDAGGHNGSVDVVLFDSKNRLLISGGTDGNIRIWDLYSGRPEKTISDFRSRILDLTLSPDDRFLAAAGNRNELYVWEFPMGTLKGKLQGHRKKVAGAAFSINGDQILSVGMDRQMIIWSLNTLGIVRKTDIEARTIRGSGIDVKTAAFSFDRQFVGVGIEEHILAKGGRSMIFKYNMSFYDWKTGGEIATLSGNRKDLAFFSISPDKKYVITDNSTLQTPRLSIWNIQSGLIEQNYPIGGPMSCAAFSQDGRWIAVGYRDPQNGSRSHVNVWRISGMDGYSPFASSEVKSATPSGFGSSVKLTTTAEPLIQYGEKIRMAVLYFDSPGLDREIAQTATYLLEGRLGNSPFVEMVERNQINQVIEELKYQMSGMTTSNAVEIGRHLNAEYVLLGSLNKLGSLLILSAKLVNVETSQIEGTREVQCANATIENISDMVSALAPAIAKY